MVAEIIAECVDYGITTQLGQTTVLERIHSKYLAPKQAALALGLRPPGSAGGLAGVRGGQFRHVPRRLRQAATSLMLQRI